MELYLTLMRHGASLGDIEDIHEGRFDAPLIDLGRAQVRERADGWLRAGVTFDLVQASPLLRARETAEIVSSTLGVPLEFADVWMEADNGPVAGLRFDVAAERYPMPAFRNPYEPYFGTGESGWEIHNRATKAVEQVVRRAIPRVLVVAHGGILGAAMRHIVGAPPIVNWLGMHFVFGDTSYADLSYDPQHHRWYLHQFQRGAHTK